MEIRNDCKEYFKVKITRKTDDHFVAFRNDKYEKIQGRIRMGISVKDSTHVYIDIVDLFSTLRPIKDGRNIRLQKFDEIIRGLHLENNIDATITFDNRINKLQHKLESLKYHMNECLTHEKKYEEKYKDKYVNSIVELGEIDPVFVFGIESFLFQTKSALDVLAHIIAIAFRLGEVYTYHRDGEDLIDKIEKTSAHREYQEQKEAMIGIIQRNKNWIKHLVFMRDLITHYSDLLDSKSLTHRAAFDNDEYAIVCYPCMPNGERVTTFMNNIWTSLTRLINDVSRNITVLYDKVS
jgi:hypothetical protein